MKDLQTILLTLQSKDNHYQFRRLYRLFLNQKFITDPRAVKRLHFEEFRVGEPATGQVRNLLTKILSAARPESKLRFDDPQDLLSTLREIINPGDNLKITDLSRIYENPDLKVLRNVLKERFGDERFLRLINKFIREGELKFSRNKTFSGALFGSELGLTLMDYYLAKPEESYRRKNKGLVLRYRNLLITVSQEKDGSEETVIPAGKQGIILGYEVRNTPKGLILRVPQRVIRDYILRFGYVRNIDEKPLMSIHRKSLIYLTDEEILKIYNTELKRIYIYYSLATNVSRKIGELKHILEGSLLKTLARKHRSRLSKVKNTYKTQSSDLRINNTALFKGFKTRKLKVTDKLPQRFAVKT